MKAKIERIWYEVGEKDIRYGARGEADSCPLAFALDRATGVDSWFVWYDHASESGSFWNISKKAKAFMRAFDRYDLVEPFRGYVWRRVP